MVRETRAWRWLMVPVALLLSAAPSFAAMTARADRVTLGVNDSFQVVFETDQDVSGAPDFSPLEEDFDILGTAQSTSINVINGQVRRAISWVVDLMPKREGALMIPAISIGDELSNVVEIEVQPSAAGGADGPVADVLLEASVDDPSPYVQGQVILTIRFLHSVPIGSASLTEPRVSGGDVVVEKLGDDVGYETDRGGTRMAVVERRYALFAQSSGSFVIEPFLFEGRVTGNRRFGLDPFSRGRVVRTRSKAIDVEVRPIPAAFTGTAWLPAKQLLLVEKAPDEQSGYRVGEPITRTLTMQATGLTTSQLPEISAPVAPGIRQYPDQPLLEDRVGSDGIVGIRQEKVALIPSESGTLTLPAVELPWWNTGTDRLEYARLPARTIDVRPAPEATAASPAPRSSPDAIPDADGVAAVADGTASVAPRVDAGRWQWLSLALAVGWAATALAWWLSRRRRARRVTPITGQADEKTLIMRIEHACASGDGNATKNALLAWASRQWPGSRVQSLGALAARLDGDLQEQVHKLSRHLYRYGEDAWDGVSFWQAFKPRARPKSTRPESATAELEPLYLQR